jgi:hypothetical protein
VLSSQVASKLGIGLVTLDFFILVLATIYISFLLIMSTEVYPNLLGSKRLVVANNIYGTVAC